MLCLLSLAAEVEHRHGTLTAMRTDHGADLADDDAYGDYEQFELLAARKSADILCETVRLLAQKEGE